MNRNRLLFLIAWVAGVLIFQSCGSVRYDELLMLENVQSVQDSVIQVPVLQIRTDDILSIQVTSRKPETVSAFLLQKGNSAVGENALGLQDGYRVDEEGNIYLPFLGAVQAAGKTVTQLRRELMEQLAVYIPDASIQVRFLNFRITVLGEVRRPSTYTIPNERVTVLEAIGMAGDFTEYARRKDVLIIRDRNGKREFERINVQGKDLFQSPYFFLSPNDIIYVSPLKAKSYATQGDFLQRYQVVIVPLLTFVTIVVANAISN